MPLPDPLKTAVVCGVALAIGMAVAGPVAEACRRVGFRDPPGRHKSHRAPVPLGGFLFVLPLWWELVRAGHTEWFVAAAVVLGIGLWEDIRKVRGGELHWALRLLVLTAAPVGAAWYAGAELSSLAVLGGIAVVWAATHAFNWFDHADGLSAGAGAGAVLGLLLAGRVELAPALGVLAAFWLVNGVLGRSATLYLGDSGAQTLGFSVAALALLPAAADGEWRPVFALLAALIPVADALRVCVLRTAKGRALWQPDREHHLGHGALAKSLPRGWMPTAVLLSAALVTFLFA